MLRGHELIKDIPTFYCLGTTKEIAHVAIGHMPSALEQGCVQLWFMPPKSCAPDPWLTLGSYFGCHDFTIHPPMLEVKHCETVEVALLARESFSPKQVTNEKQCKEGLHHCAGTMEALPVCGLYCHFIPRGSSGNAVRCPAAINSCKLLAGRDSDA